MPRKLKPILRSARADERGQALVLFAGGLVAFLGLAAMSIDVGTRLPVPW